MPDLRPDPASDPSPEDNRRDTAKLKAVLVLCATIAFAVSPVFTQPFSGFNPDQLPNPVDQPPIQPAGYAFSIWGAIYLWLLVSAGFGLIKRDTPADWDAPRWPLFVSVGLGASWIAVALSAPVIATAMIWVMGAGAAIALLRAPTRDRALAALPIGLYAGWLTAASCVALATILMGHDILSPLVASWACLALALAIAVPLSRRSGIPTYPFAVGWALVGIVVQNATLYPALAGAAALGAIAMGWLTARTLRPEA